MIRMTVDVSDAEAAIRDAVRRLNNPRPMFASIGAYLLRRTQEHFEQERDPEGQPWAALAASTVESKRRRRKIQKTLQQDGDLRGGINYVASDAGVAIGSPLPYSAIHQLGGKAGRGRSVTIAPRPYLGLSDRDVDVISAIASDFVEG